MKLTRTHYLIGGLVILILLVFVAMFGFGNKQPAPAGTEGATTTVSTTTGQAMSSTTPVGNTSGYTIKTVPVEGAPAAPAYKNSIACPSSFSPEACTSMADTDAQIVASISKNPKDWSAWIELGILRQQAGDYQGAATVWIYVTKVYPDDAVAYHNLGNLYEFYLKDSSKAESILKQGIANSPKAVSLQLDLARLYKALGETAQANAEYDAAIQNAQAQGQTQLASQITAEKTQ